MRTINWESRLNEYIDKCRSRSFSWGEWDCGLFVADCLQIILGVDFGMEWRGRYHDEKGAAAVMARHYVETVEQVFDIVAARHASFFRPVPVSAARRGDVVAFDTPKNGPALGICLGDKCAFPNISGGLAFVKLGRCRRAWSVGRCQH